MSRFLQNNDSLTVCHKNSCIHAKGDNARIIAFGAFVMLFFIGIAAIAKASR